MKCISVLHLKCVSYCPCFYWQTWFYKMPTFIYRDQLLVQQRSLILCWHYVLSTIHVVWESKIVFIHYVTSIKSCTSMIYITQPVFLCALFLCEWNYYSWQLSCFPSVYVQLQLLRFDAIEIKSSDNEMLRYQQLGKENQHVAATT